MRYASLIWKSGLLGALSVALFVGCKKEKEQNGPSLTVAGDPGVVTGDRTLAPAPATHSLRFKLIAQKGSGKDDADLKDYSFTVNLGGTNIPVYANRSVPNGTSFTIDTTVSASGGTGTSVTYTFTVTDKNGKSVSKSFRITFQDTTGTPTLYVDSLMNQNYTNQADTNGTHLRYQVGTGTLTLQNRTQANNNPSEILFVYWYSNASGRHSVISPAILGTSIYNGIKPEWDNPSTQQTIFRQVPTNVNFATAGYADIVSAYTNGTPINDFTGNSDQRAECTAGRVLAFKQGNIYGLIRVDNVTTGGAGATLSVKIARP